jgi:hypothetical protein
MGTATVSAPPAVSVTTDIRTFYRVLYVSGTSKEGQPEHTVKIVNEKIGQKVKSEGVFEGKEVAALQSQSFIQPTADTDAGWAQLIPEEGERAAMTARGASTKLDNKARAWLSALDDDGNFVNDVTEAPFDQTEDLKALSSRRLSPAERIQEELSGMQFTPSMLEAFELLLAKKRAQAEG